MSVLPMEILTLQDNYDDIFKKEYGDNYREPGI